MIQLLLIWVALIQFFMIYLFTKQIKDKHTLLKVDLQQTEIMELLSKKLSLLEENADLLRKIITK